MSIVLLLPLVQSIFIGVQGAEYRFSVPVKHTSLQALVDSTTFLTMSVKPIDGDSNRNIQSQILFLIILIMLD